MLDKLPRKLLVLKLRDCRSIMQAELAPALTRLNCTPHTHHSPLHTFHFF
jgi:hypothetical protein